MIICIILSTFDSILCQLNNKAAENVTHSSNNNFVVRAVEMIVRDNNNNQCEVSHLGSSMM